MTTLKGKQVNPEYVPVFYGPVEPPQNLDDHLHAIDQKFAGVQNHKVVSYGRFFAQLKGVPTIDDSSVQNAAITRGARDIYEQFDPHYRRCFFQLVAYDSGGTVTKISDLTFATVSDMTVAVQALPPTTDWVTLEAYDYVYPELLPPTNLYATNGTYERLITGRYYHPRDKTCQPTGWAPQPDALNALWDLLHPGFPLPPPASWTSNEYGLFWLAQNARGLYRFDGHCVTQGSSNGGRYALDAGVAVPAPTDSYQQQTVGSAAYLAARADGTSYDAIPFNKYRRVANAVYQGDGVVVGLALQAPGGQRSAMVKPLGINKLRTSPLGALELNAVGAYSANGTVRLRRMTPNSPDDVYASGVYPLTEWVKTSTQNISGYGYNPRPGQTSFFVRDPSVPGKVSPYAGAHVEWLCRKRYRPLGALLVGGQGNQG